MEEQTETKATDQVAAPFELLQGIRVLAAQRSKPGAKVTIKMLVSQALEEFLERNKNG